MADIVHGVLVLSLLLAGLAGAVWSIYRFAREHRLSQRYAGEFRKLCTRERLDRLRHQNFDLFVQELNSIRSKRGLPPIPKETLRKVQFNLMFSLDEA